MINCLHFGWAGFARQTRLIISGILLLGLVMAAADAGADDSMPDKVRHILEHRCVACHNNIDRKGLFSVQSRSEFLDSGYVEPGDAESSHLLSVLTADGNQPASMPKDGSPLSAEEVATIREWITAGADWPEDLVLTEPQVDNFDWWSLHPLTRPAVPAFTAAEDSQWVQSPVDGFVLSKLREQHLSPSPQADRQTLIRRLSYDLTGLPPSPEEVERFLADDAADAYEQLVERLLASPRYGERWARHWLDVVKYADTCGYDKDKLRPNAWPYRDYVIRSFNQDKPYAQFVQEQIAGDTLFPGNPDGILGLGFIAAGPWDFIGHVEVPESKIDGMVARSLDRDDMVSNTLNTFCSVTIQCARCHNHKFDPFTQEHYYSLQSIFAAVDRAERRYNTDPQTEQRRTELQMELAEVNSQLKSLDDEIRTAGGERLTAAESLVTELQPKAEPADKRPEYGYHSGIVSSPDTMKWVEVDLGREVTIDRVVLRPCHDDFGGIGAGFGFPLRFHVDISQTSLSSDGSATAAPGQSLVAEQMTDSQDFPNPGLAAVSLQAEGRRGRYVRVTATGLAERQNDFIFALAELEVLDAQGRNQALNANVTALDSIEAPIRWRKSNLTDGIAAQPADPDAAQLLAAARLQLAEIMAEVNTAERVARRQELTNRRQAVQTSINELPDGKMVYAAATQFASQGNFKPTGGTPRTVHLLHRGNVQQPQAEMSPGVIPLSAETASAWHLELDENHSEADRRAALAGWITSSDNPLTWRSIANRVWQYHFGRGLVDSPNDFGRMGQLPTHPELLDWLAAEFRETQSFKHLHRLIVNSSVYRQVSQRTVDGTGDAGATDPSAVDGNNQYLWRMNRRRLSAEEIRDSILAVSGRLNLEMGGPGFYLFELERTEHSPHYEYHKFDPSDENSHRRSVYRFIVRSQPDPYMTTLDCADSSQSTPKRTETLTSLQALSMLNNRFSLTMAEYFAERLQKQSDELPQQVHHGFRLVTGRDPRPEEAEAMVAYAGQHGLINLSRILFNLSEFVFVD